MNVYAFRLEFYFLIKKKLKMRPTILYPKTRAQIAEELKISIKKFRQWLKDENIILPKGLVTPKYKQIIFEKWYGRNYAD